MLHLFAQATQPSHDVPQWAVGIGSIIKDVLTGIGGAAGVTALLIAWMNRGRLTALTTNSRTLATASLANANAIDASPGPSVSPAAKAAVVAIQCNPTVAVEPPTQIDPVPPKSQTPRVQT